MPYGAGHGAEIAYVFHNINARRGDAETTTTDEEVAHILNTYWANFAKSGNPNGEGLPVWPGYNTEKEEILDIQPDGQIIGKSDPRKQRLDVIEKATECRTRIQSRGGI
jgi:para-nitrobenzyl esterase